MPGAPAGGPVPHRPHQPTPRSAAEGQGRRSRRACEGSLEAWRAPWSPQAAMEDGFTHKFCGRPLFLNLKDRLNTARVPSEYIPALGGIRTDLDQFSFIEREALMYHGYTLIDAQIKEYCKRLWALIPGDVPQMEQPPLFRDRPSSDQAAEQCASETKLRKRVKDVLTAGSDLVFLFRSRRKYPKKSWLVIGPAISLFCGGWWAIRHYWESIYTLTLPLERWLSFLIPDWVRWVLKNLVGSSSLPLDTQVLTGIILIALWFYFVAFLTYVAMRRLVRRWDLTDYRSLTGEKPTVHWTRNDASSTAL